MTKRPQILEQIVNIAREHKKIGTPVRAIFDLDSTLFDVSPRITKILRAFAELPETKSRYPEQAHQLLTLTPDVRDYGVRRTLERSGFILPAEPQTQAEFKTRLTEYWKFHFFGNDYLVYDEPYPGAQNYVCDLVAAGAEIFYLTGRDIPRMGRGTIESLKQHGFPLEPGHANLFMKPTQAAKDTDFKRDFFIKMGRIPSEIWFFENEPANIHLVVEHSPHIKIVFVDTVHSGIAPVPGDNIPRIEGYI